MQDVLVSVIVPVYNVESAIRHCVDSIREQKEQNIEIILVNDGSKDNSLEVCRELASLDDRVRVIDQPNGGAGAARNAGLEVSQGQYIYFVDSDDWIEPNMLEELLRLIRSEGGFDVAICNYYIEDEMGKTTEIHAFPLPKDPYFSADVPRCVIELERLSVFPYLWNRLYLKSIIDQFEVRFEPHFVTGQDLDFNLQYFSHVKRYAITNKALYHYLKQGSNSLCARYKQNLYEMISELSDRREAFYHEIGISKTAEYDNVYPQKHVEYLHACIPNMFRKNAPLSFSNRVVAMQQLFQNEKLITYMGAYRPGNINGKLYQWFVKHQAYRLATVIYSFLFFIRNRFERLYQFLRRITSK